MSALIQLSNEVISAHQSGVVMAAGDGILDWVSSKNTQTQTVLNTLDQAQTRTNVMNRALRQVEALPDGAAQSLLPRGADEGEGAAR